jgi:hypothetical protein
MFAPTMTAPSESKTVPASVAFVDWDHKVGTAKASRKTAANRILIRVIKLPPESIARLKSRTFFAAIGMKLAREGPESLKGCNVA